MQYLKRKHCLRCGYCWCISLCILLCIFLVCDLSASGLTSFLASPLQGFTDHKQRHALTFNPNSAFSCGMPSIKFTDHNKYHALMYNPNSVFSCGMPPQNVTSHNKCNTLIYNPTVLFPVVCHRGDTGQKPKHAPFCMKGAITHASLHQIGPNLASN